MIKYIAGWKVKLNPIPRCEVCEKRVIVPLMRFAGHTLCSTHLYMARGAYLFLACKIDHDIGLEESMRYTDAVVHCLREEHHP